MRRFLAVLVVVLAAQTSFAASESSPREAGPRLAEGRAFILTPAQALSDADRAELAAKGVTVKQALTGGRYLVRVSETASLAGEARVVAIEPLTADRKIDRSARREAASGRTMASINVIFHRDVTFQDAMQAVIAAGGAVEPFTFRYLPAQRIEAKIAPSALTALADDERVFAITGPRNFKVTANNAASAAVAHVTDVQAAPYGLTGQGVVVSLFELGEMQATHVELAGRVTTHPPGFCNPSSAGCGDDIRHATHVAGTIIASGVRADAKGMAPKATIHEFPVSRTWLSLKENQLPLTGSRVDNNSWGYTLGWESGDVPLWNGGGLYYGAYDLIVGAPLDKISNEEGILFVHSAGNDGSSLPVFGEWKEHHHLDLSSPTFEELPGLFCVSKSGSGTDCPAQCTGVDTVSKEGPCEIGVHGAATPFDTMGVTASAKNVIAVGALSTTGGIAGYSSRGPAKDGRVKPDLVARGSSVRSSVPTDGYASLSGTSMSSPAVTGVAALLVEQWRRTFAGATPKPAHLKALLIAGTNDLGNPGPDYTFGFGLVDAKKSVDLILADAGRGERIRDLTFAQGQSQTQHEIPLVVTEQTNLRVVLNWPDAPIAMPVGSDDDIAEEALVNNLDLKVIDPSGNSVLPWTLNKNQVEANATRGVNNVDNVEMVEIANAVPGVYRVVATGTRVNEGPQTAVLVTNVRTARACFDVQETASSNNTSETAYNGLSSGAKIYGGLCSSADVDFYKFTATKTGPVSVTVTTGDTALRVTLTGTGISRTQDIAANSTAVLNADANTAPNAITLEIEALGILGAEPQYSFTPVFGVTVPKKGRVVRH